MSMIRQDRQNSRIIANFPITGTINHAVRADTAAIADSATGFNIQRTFVGLNIATTPDTDTTGSVTMGRAGVLFNVETTIPMRFRLYTSPTFRDADIARPVTQFPTGESGLVTELVLSGSVDILNFAMSPAVNYANAEVPSTPELYYTARAYSENPESIGVVLSRIVFEG